MAGAISFSSPSLYPPLRPGVAHGLCGAGFVGFVATSFFLDLDLGVLRFACAVPPSLLGRPVGTVAFPQSFNRHLVALQLFVTYNNQQPARREAREVHLINTLKYFLGLKRLGIISPVFIGFCVAVCISLSRWSKGQNSTVIVGLVTSSSLGDHFYR